MTVHPLPYRVRKDQSPSPERGAPPKRGALAPARLPGHSHEHSSSWRRLRHEVGLAVPLLDRLQREHAGDPYAQLVGFFDAFQIPAATGRRRAVSLKTRDKYFNILRRVLHALRELNMRNQNLGDLSQRQVRAITRAWECAGASASSLATLNTVLRRFGCWIGKPALALPLPQLLADPQAGVRSSSAVEPRSWESHGIDPEAVFQAMAGECVVTAMQLRLAWAFGLRAEEQLMFRPHESHQGDWLVITRGTKGGRPRRIAIEAQWELDLVEQAKVLAAGRPKQILCAGRGRSLEQARNHYYYLCQRIGLCRDGRFPGTPHGARHSFAVRRYQQAGGVPAPVIGGAMPPPNVDRAARQAVAEELGHSRPTITSAYIGSVPKLNAVARRRLARLAERELLLGGDPQLRAFAHDAELSSFCLVGPAATGDRLTGPALVLCEAQQPIADVLLQPILARAGELLHVVCIPSDRNAVRIGQLPTFEIPALARAGARDAPPVVRGQLQLDLGWPTA